MLKNQCVQFRILQWLYRSIWLVMLSIMLVAGSAKYKKYARYTSNTETHLRDLWLLWVVWYSSSELEYGRMFHTTKKVRYDTYTYEV